MKNPKNPDPLLAWPSLGDQEPCCVPEPKLDIENLTLRYGQQVAFEKVNLTVNRGCVTAIVGPSGCGKSSFLQSLNRLTDLLPQCLVQGRILLDGRDIFEPDTDVVALRRKVGMIFQKPNPFPFSIRKNLTFPLRQHGIRDRRELDRVVEGGLRDVGLWDEVSHRLDQPALNLSGGQQQRLCIARALVLKPEILLYDEPCSALDPMSSAVVEALIDRLRGRFTQIVVTHNLAQARRLADYLAVFWAGEQGGFLVESGTCADIFEAPSQTLTQQYIQGHQG